MRIARTLTAWPFILAVGCTIYSSSLLGGDDSDGSSPTDTSSGDSTDETCKSGASDCESGMARSCVAGHWQVEERCPKGCSDAGACVENPSCTAGGPGADQTCGSTSTTDCCASLAVPSGTYLRSGIDSGTATVSAYHLDEFEVTVGRFRKFVNLGLGTQLSPPSAGAGANPHVKGSGWDPKWNSSLPSSTDSLETSFSCEYNPTWTDAIEDTDGLPMNCITWFEAFAFCAWDGGRLATEAEWNLAAAAGEEDRWFPWSEPATSEFIDPTYAVYDCTGHNGGPPMFFDGGDGSSDLSCSLADILPVGSRPKGNGKWGHADLSGNMNEWILDWYLDPYPSPCDDCAALDAGTPDGAPQRIFRSGGYYYDESVLPS